MGELGELRAAVEARKCSTEYGARGALDGIFNPSVVPFRDLKFTFRKLSGLRTRLRHVRASVFCHACINASFPASKFSHFYLTCTFTLGFAVAAFLFSSLERHCGIFGPQ